MLLSVALLAALLLSAAALYALQRWRKRHVYALARQLRSKLTYVPFLGHSYIFFGSNENRMKAFHSLGRDAIQRENGLCPLWLGTKFFTVIADPQAAEIVLKTSLEKDDIMKMATIFFGNGSIFAPVAIWKPRRKVLMSAFGTKDMKHFLSIFNKHSAALVERLAGAAGAGRLSAWRYFTAYTMDAIAEATLGYEMHAQRESAHPFLVAFDEVLKETAKRLLSPWLHSDLVYNNLPVYKKLIAWRNYLWTFTKELIDKKRKEIKESGFNEDETTKNVPHERRRTFLEMLVRSSGADAGYTDVEVLEELLVIMMAGNDTSAVGASFVSLMLARHPRVQDAVYEELRDVFGDSERPVTSEDLPRLKYLDAVVRETLRLYAPVPVIVRKIEKEIILPSGIKLVPGSGVVVNVWAINRHPRYWGADAEQFRPERFLDAPPRHPAAFMAFSHGPRNCVGYQFALTSMKTVLASMLRSYKLLPAGGADAARPLRLCFDIMMKDADGFQVQLEHRSKQ